MIEIEEAEKAIEQKVKLYDGKIVESNAYEEKDEQLDALVTIRMS